MAGLVGGLMVLALALTRMRQRRFRQADERRQRQRREALDAKWQALKASGSTVRHRAA